MASLYRTKKGVNKVCERCGKIYYANPSRVNTGKYCSRECYYNSHNITLICEHCSKEFKIRLGDHRKSRGKYCSRSCFWKAFWKKNDTKVKKYCARCGKEFYVLQVRKDTAKYCSVICAQPNFGKPREGFRGKDSRHEEKKWRRSVLKRDNNMCVNCGCTDKRLLQAHHKEPWVNEETRYDVDNGVTLCVECHAKEHPDIATLMMAGASWRQTINM